MKRVLIVDDEPDIAQLMKQLLEQAGFSAEYALDARKGIKMIGRFDIVLLDLLMPQMSGQEFLAEAKKDGANVPIIVVSALVLGSEEKEALSAKYPGVGFLSKLDIGKGLVNAVNARLRK